MSKFSVSENNILSQKKMKQNSPSCQTHYSHTITTTIKSIKLYNVILKKTRVSENALQSVRVRTKVD